MRKAHRAGAGNTDPKLKKVLALKQVLFSKNLPQNQAFALGGLGVTRDPDSLAPQWLPRQQRRRVDRRLRELLGAGTCSVCRNPLRHNSQTVSGLDVAGNVTVAGECCSDRVIVIFGRGHYVDRRYDFLSAAINAQPPNNAQPSNTEPSNEQIMAAIAASQQAVAEADKWLGDIERRGASGMPTPNVSLLDHPWKDDDRIWFEQNPHRAHRARRPFPGEVNNQAARAPAGHTIIMLLRQVEPGSRLKTGFYLNADLLPVPDDEALTHALFEIAIGREAVPSEPEAFFTLMQKYAGGPRQ